MNFIVTTLKIKALSMLRLLDYCVLTIPPCYNTYVSNKNDLKNIDILKCLDDFHHDTT